MTREQKESNAAYWLRGYLVSATTDPAMSEEVQEFARECLEKLYVDNPVMRKEGV